MSDTAGPFVPFDATEEELAELHVLQEGVPAHLTQPIGRWLYNELTYYDSSVWRLVVDLEKVTRAQLNLRINLRLTTVNQRSYDERMLVLAISDLSGRNKLRLCDYLLRKVSEVRSVVELNEILRSGMSKWAVEEDPDTHELGLHARVPQGVQLAVEHTIASAGDAGKQLAMAWNDLYGIDPSPSDAYLKAVKAVELAGRPVTLPNKPDASLGHIIGELDTNANWVVPLQITNAELDHRKMLVDMLRTLWQGHEDRHDLDRLTFDQAQAAVHLAATLVAWFNDRIVRKK